MDEAVLFKFGKWINYGKSHLQPVFTHLNWSMTISPHSSDNGTGWRRRSKLSSSLLSLFTSVGSRQRHRTSSRNYASRQTLSLDVVCGQPHHHHWLSAVRGCLRRRSCFSGRRRTHLERSAAARHVCTLAACFSQSSEDSSLQTLLSMTPSSVFCRACEVTRHNRTR